MTFTAHHLGSFLEIQARDDEGLNQRLKSEDGRVGEKMFFTLDSCMVRRWETKRGSGFGADTLHSVSVLYMDLRGLCNIEVNISNSQLKL